jgi:hypothetical protein
MAVNGKAKGSTFERKIANLLSARFKMVTGIEQGFRRNPDSGSFFGGSNKKRVSTHDLDYAIFGDLICPTLFKFSVECKSYKTGPTFAAIVKGKVAHWDEWLAQARQDAVNAGKEMMLIVKYNGTDEVVFLDTPIHPGGLATELFRYKNSYVYRLEEVLNLNDNRFFDSSININPSTATSVTLA